MIDTKVIRKKILHAALSGKLVKQDPADESARELVLRTSKSLKVEPHMAESSDDGLYDIPPNWCWCRLSNIGKTNIGVTYHPEDVNQQGTIVIRSSNIINGKMDYSDLVKVDCEIKDSQYLEENDIVICARNGSKALVGKCAIYYGEYKKASFGAFMAVFKTKFYKYVYYYFLSDVFRRYFSNDDSKQINQVTQSILKESLIPVPPLNEQVRIVDAIDKAFELLDAIDDLQAKYNADVEVLKDKIIDAGIRGKLTKQLPEDGDAEDLYAQIQEEKQRLIAEGKMKKEKRLPEIDEDEIPFEIPRNWKWVRAGNILRVINGTSYDKRDILHQGIRILRGGNIVDFNVEYLKDDVFLPEEYYDAEKNVLGGDIIIVASTGSETAIGRPGIVRKQMENTQIGAFLRIIRGFKVETMPFLALLFMSDYYLQHIRHQARGTNINNVKEKYITELMVPLPPLKEQERITEAISNAIKTIEY